MVMMVIFDITVDLMANLSLLSGPKLFLQLVKHILEYNCHYNFSLLISSDAQYPLFDTILFRFKFLKNKQVIATKRNFSFYIFKQKAV